MNNRLYHFIRKAYGFCGNEQLLCRSGWIMQTCGRQKVKIDEKSSCLVLEVSGTDWLVFSLQDSVIYPHKPRNGPLDSSASMYEYVGSHRSRPLASRGKRNPLHNSSSPSTYSGRDCLPQNLPTTAPALGGWTALNVSKCGHLMSNRYACAASEGCSPKYPGLLGENWINFDPETKQRPVSFANASGHRRKFAEMMLSL